MSGAGDNRDAQDAPLGAPEIRALHEKRVAAELEAADRLAPGSDAVPPTGSVFPQVALIKGNRGPAEESGGAAMSGADGEAADRALVALGFDADSTFRTLSRPEPGATVEQRADRLRAQLEAVDPEVIVALDRAAADDLVVALGIAELEPGVVVRVLGRTVLAVDGFEASLVDDARKRRVWMQLKAVTRAT